MSSIRKQWLIIFWFGLALTGFGLLLFSNITGGLAQPDEREFILSTPTPPPTVPAAPPQPEQILSGIIPGLPPGAMLVEGDILIQITDFPLRYPSASQNSPHAPDGAYRINLWPNGQVPYELSSNVTLANRTRMETAMSWWEDVAGVDFVHCTDNVCTGDHLRIQDNDFNNSFVGRRGGEQIVNISDWNIIAIVAHELGHALGLEHEQNRPGRDQFVNINWGNICEATDTTCIGGFCFDADMNRIDCDHNFELATGASVYGSYDFGSVMHYRRDAFSRNGNNTITVQPPFDEEWQNAIGQRARLSERDKNVMGCMYPRANWRWAATGSGGTQVGSCTNPYRSIGTGLNSTPLNGTLWLEPGAYSGVTTLTRPMTLKAPNGAVTLRN